MGISNTYLGELAGLLGTTGDENTFIGQEAGRENTTGSSNTFVGEDAGLSNTIGDLNSFLGCNAGVNADQSNRNTFIGSFAGQSSFEGVNNTYLGVFTGQENTLGVNNTFLGSYAGRKTLTGQFNTYVGMNAGHDNREGSANVFLGYQAGFNEQGSNKLYIANNPTSDPLIYGEFDNKIITVNGALGVGIKNPERPIHLRAKNAIFRIDRDRNDPGFAIVRYDAGFNNVWKSFYFYTRGNGPNDGKFVIADWGQNVSGASTARLVIANDGNVGIGNFLFTNPSQKLTVSGNVLATGSYITSDKRFKRNIQALPQALENLAKIRGVSYEFANKKFAERGLPQGKTIGLIAQEVEKIYPELVAEDAEGYKSINYDGLIPVLIEALKAQQKQIEAQNQRIATLEKNKINTSSEASNETPQLFQNQPNPFDQSTLIPYSIPEGVTQAKILVTDLQGKEVMTLPIQKPGKSSVSLQAGRLSKGIYLYTLIVDGSLMDTKRMLIE